MADEGQEKRRIIIDEDWKSQVEAEREEQKRREAQPDAAGAGGESEQPEQPGQLPPPSFAFLVSTMATQAMAALGQIPDPVEQKPVVRLELAKHHVDTLAMLQEKTKGNLTAEETNMLEDVLHQLRMLYVAVRDHLNAPGAAKSDS